jgi:hypothetical protein
MVGVGLHHHSGTVVLAILVNERLWEAVGLSRLYNATDW